MLAIAVCTFNTLAHANPATSTSSNVCIISGTPSTDQYQVIKRVKAAKGTYGSVEELDPKIKAVAQKLNADAVINFHASQRFGFWPWRVVRPVATGTAVKLSPNSNCAALGGRLI